MGKSGDCLEKEMTEDTLPGKRARGRPQTWLDNVETWTGFSLEEALRATEARAVWWRSFMMLPTLERSRRLKDKKRQSYSK